MLDLTLFCDPVLLLPINGREKRAQARFETVRCIGWLGTAM